jgi:hypothetical protein
VKSLKDYEVDEIITLLQMFRALCEELPEVQDEIDSVLDLLQEDDHEIY